MAMQNGARDPLQLPQRQTNSAGSQLCLACSAPCGLLLSLLWVVPALAQPESPSSAAFALPNSRDILRGRRRAAPPRGRPPRRGRAPAPHGRG
ncbi:TolC family protein, partial [Synechococcus sp. W60.3]